MQEVNFNGNGKFSSNGNGKSPGLPAPVKGFDIQANLDKVLRNWYWFVLSIVAMLFASWLYLRYATPEYNVAAKLLIEDDNKNGGAPGQDALQQLQLFDSKSSVDNEVEILKSRFLMEKVVMNLQLNVSYFIEGRVKEAEQFSRLPFTFKWVTLNDSLRNTNYIVSPIGNDKFSISRAKLTREAKWGDTLQFPEGILRVVRNAAYPFVQDKYIVKITSIDRAVALYRKLVNFNIPNKQVSTIDMTLTTGIPEKGEKVVNKIIETYLQASVEDKNKIADSTISFIDKRLVLVSKELNLVEKDIQSFKETNKVANLDEQAKQMVAGTGDYKRQLTDQQIKLNVVESLQQYVEDDTNNKRVVPSSLVVQDPTFVALIDRYNSLQLEKGRQLLSSTESNPYVQNIDKQLAAVRTDLKNNLISIKKGLQLSVNELTGGANALNREIHQVPAKERVFLDFSRQQAIRQELYVFLLKKREESAISKSSNMAIARIIDPAKSESSPFKPKKIPIYVVAFLLGAVIPAGILYVIEILNKRVSGKQDILSNTSVGILAEIGHSSEKNMMIVNKEKVSPIVEQFRSMRTNLQFVLSGANEKVILLTSSMGGEGKSFIASNLAMVLALSGKKVVLLEMDLRKPKISSNLGIPNNTGFSTYVIGKTTIESILKPSGFHDNFYVVPSGPIPPNPAELLLLDKTTLLFKELKAQFDYIIVDTAPIGLVTDAQLLGRHADTTLYLVRQGYTYKQQLQLPQELYVKGKMPRINLVVNDVKYGSGYGYSYGGYGYGGYGFEEKKGLAKRVKKVFSRS